MGEYVYGCDRCLKACPHNSHCIATNIDSFAPSQAFLDMMPDEWQHLSVERYRELFKGSAVKRAKYEGLMRNIHIAEDSGKQKEKE
jgi:epoxyqueuosine reductase